MIFEREKILAFGNDCLGIKQTYRIDACSEKALSLPPNLGTSTWRALTCPVDPGTINTAIDFTTSLIIPVALAKADVTTSAVDQDGENAVRWVFLLRYHFFVHICRHKRNTIYLYLPALPHKPVTPLVKRYVPCPPEQLSRSEG